jgi:hypothetical protein
MSLVFQNFDPPPPSPPGECVLCTPAFVGGGRTHSPGGEGDGGGSIFWKTRDIGLPSYSNNLSAGLIYEGAIGETASLCNSLHASILCTTRLEGEVGEDWRIVSTPLPGETEAAPPPPAPAPPSRYKHCNENSIHVFLFWELRGLSPNYHIHLAVSDFTDKK